MDACWPVALGCLVVGGLSATARLAFADLLHLVRQLGIDASTLAGLGWTVAALLYLRLRIERAHRLRRPGDLGPSAGTDPTCTRERGEPDGD
ncbi:MAG: hypothetical protein KatS3mg117_0061 [Geminicoccaceae bacterium]|nr:MAG: hypothetical protein KatS3mg117_0061 [Geminicoccaceae bacterium]